MGIVISGTGLFLPPDIITNQELVSSFNRYVERFNLEHQDEIEQGKIDALAPSSEAFIVKASGIKQRHVVDKSGILDIDVMQPQFAEYSPQGTSIQAQMAINAAKNALEAGNKSSTEIDLVIATCSGFQRHYPALAIEVQDALGITGFAYDMNVACSSIPFAIYNAFNAIKNNNAKAALIVSPEIFTAQTNFRDRKSHFLFGDAATAFIVERAEDCRYPDAYELIDCTLKTSYSKNILNEFGFTNSEGQSKNLFTQQGNKVFKEVVKASTELFQAQLARLDVGAPKRFWLHQANGNMNRLIVNKILSRNPTLAEAPLPIESCGNTSSCGSMIAFHQHHRDLDSGDYGLLATFGAGYSIGSIVLRKL